MLSFGVKFLVKIPLIECNFKLKTSKIFKFNIKAIIKKGKFYCKNI